MGDRCSGAPVPEGRAGTAPPPADIGWAGFRISVSSGFGVLVGLLCFLSGPGLALPFLFSAGLHECGHLLALRLLRIPVCGLELRASGAVLRAELPCDLREAWAAAAGPAVNLLLCGCCFRLWPALWLCSAAQLLWNLLPVLPLDGGRICAILLPRLFGPPGFRFWILLSRAALCLVVLGGVWGTCVLRLGLLPILAAALFLLQHRGNF